MSTPVMLVILDGFGLAPAGEGNAVERAETPNFDHYWEHYPHTQLQASERAVGLPPGQMGNSEVGHMNIGAGRIVQQSLSYIQEKIETAEIKENAVLNELFSNTPGSLHLMGLVSDGGVHSDIGHLYGLLALAAEKTNKTIYIHVFTDGRDTAPDSAEGFIAELEQFIAQQAHPMAIASVCGRYYAMDRDKRWDRSKKAYNAIVSGQAEHQAGSAGEAIKAAYARGESDEFVSPTIIVDHQQAIGPINDGDGVFFFNFRADRARQLTYALLGDDHWDAFQRSTKPDIHFASMMAYDETLEAPFAFALPEVKECLAEVISREGKTQYHTAETEKYPHVTYFFNAKQEQVFDREERQIIPSPQDVATYDLKPEMSAPELTEATVQRIEQAKDDFLLINYANPDMVGHTGVIEAAIKACETCDQSLGKIVDAWRKRQGAVLIIADHGNAEKMRNEDGSVHTAHTTNPVPCILLADDQLELRDGGVLGDVAPTILQLMGIAQPEVMTGKTLLSS